MIPNFKTHFKSKSFNLCPPTKCQTNLEHLTLLYNNYNILQHVYVHKAENIAAASRLTSGRLRV